MRTSAMVVLGVVGLAAGHVAGQPDVLGKGQLQRVSNGIEVEPLRVAPAVYGTDGFRKVGDWMPYGGSAGRECDNLEMVYDCIEQTGTCTNEGWFFGTSYCNMFVTNDMTVSPETDLDAGFNRIDFAWQWTCQGFGTETCYVAVFTQESVPCDADSFDYQGWIFDFGTLSCNPGGYYYTNAELSTGTWPVPSTGTGSHVLIYAQSITSSGALVLATCAQSLLWGTGDARGDPNAPGTQGPEQFDDDIDFNQSHTSSECYTYALGFCPDPLGAMVGFWQRRCGDAPCDYADYNGDSSVNTQDFLSFLNSWNAGESLANCNDDSTINTLDFLCFLNIWNACK